MHEEIAVYLESKGFANVFRLRQPNEPNTCCVVRILPGPKNDKQFGQAGTYREEARGTVVFRGEPEDPEPVAVAANSAALELSKIENQPLSGVLYENVSVSPMQQLDEDDKKRPEFQVVFTARKAPSLS
jgi:hypothetical protein